MAPPGSSGKSQKRERLERWLSSRSPLVAFSGGVDSTLLAYVAQISSPEYLAITVVSPLCPSWEAGEASSVAEKLGLRHRVVELDPLSDPIISGNPPDRCYHCKKLMLRRLIEIAKREGLDTVCDGTNADDLSVHRPGRRALTELGVASPLAEAGFTKYEIRLLSKTLGLPTWDRESMPCLATRIPYGEELAPHRLSRIDEAESFIRRLGLHVVRVRDRGEEADIEIGENELAELDLEAFRRDVLPIMRRLGYRSIGISTYKSGRWDREDNRQGG